MSEVKISALPEATTATEADFVPLVQGSVTKKANINVIRRKPQTALSNGLICAPKANIPEYPDNVAGTTYFNGNFTGSGSPLDGWTATGCTLSTAGGNLIVTATASFPRIVRTVTAERTVRFRVRRIAGIATNSRITNTTGTVYENTVLYDSTNTHIHDFYIGAGATGELRIIPGSAGSASGDVYEIEFIYIGTGLYDSLALDASGNGNHGTVYGATPVAGITGRALQFNGVNDYTLPASPGLSTDADFSIAAWINVASAHVWTGSHGIVFSEISSNPGAVGITQRSVDNTLGVAIRTTSVFAVGSSVLITRGTWNHAVLRFVTATKTLEIWQNGVLAGSVGGITAGQALATTGMRLGGNRVITGGSTSWFNGTIDDPRIYNRALSAEEIWELYQNPGGTDINDMVMSATAQPSTIPVRGPSGGLAVRTALSDPKHATAGSRPTSTMLGEIVYYSGKLYFCTNITTPTWELITSS